MLVVNLFGGPGSGKSTIAAGVFHQLKIRGINTELVTEYAKDLTWEERHHALANQPLILGQQFHRLWRIHKEVGVAITDSPIVLGAVYNKYTGHELEHLPALIHELHNLFKSINYFIIRPENEKYQTQGRGENLNVAKGIHDDILIQLARFGIEYEEVERDSAVEYIVDDLIRRGVGDIKC